MPATRSLPALTTKNIEKVSAWKRLLLTTAGRAEVWNGGAGKEVVADVASPNSGIRWRGAVAGHRPASASAVAVDVRQSVRIFICLFG